MLRTVRYVCTLAVLSGILPAASASAQSAEAHVAKAQRTLTELQQFLDGIGARQKGTALTFGREWTSLFDGTSLAGWQQTAFSSGGIHLEKKFRGGAPAIVVDAGERLSGFNWTRDVPRTNYEITLETMKIEGNDFLCGLTFPVGNSYASLILGGWGGGVVGISSINSSDASENETTKYRSFPKDRWFAVRLRVTPAKIEAWLDDKQIVDAQITGKRIALRPGDIAKSTPLGIATYQTSAAFRAIKLRRLETK